MVLAMPSGHGHADASRSHRLLSGMPNIFISVAIDDKNRMRVQGELQ